MNRFVITMGERDVSGNIVRGTTGYDIGYDAAGRRVQSTSSHPDTNGQPTTYREAYTYDAIGTLKETKIYDGNDALIARTVRANDAVGNLLDYWEYNQAGQQTQYTHYDYDRDSLKTQSLEDTSDFGQRNRTQYSYTGNGILTATQADTIDIDGNLVENTAVVTLAYAYEQWDGYKESTVTISATASNVSSWQPGTSTYQYDANGHLVHLYDSQADRTMDYINNPHGQVLKRNQIDHEPGGSDLPPVIRYFYFLDGVALGDVGTDGVNSRVDYAQILARREYTTETTVGKNPEGVPSQLRHDTGSAHGALHRRIFPVTSADFDQNYQPISDEYPAHNPQSYVVQTGDTLQAIAQRTWGDGSLWYVLADANGLSGDDTLTTGMRLSVPNVVTNLHNNANTFRPYDPGLAIGDTTPTLPTPPPSAIVATATAGGGGGSGGGCGGFAPLIMIAVAVVVTAWTGGVAAQSFAKFFGSKLAGAIVGGAVGAAAGSIASQTVGVALGVQHQIDWKGVRSATLGGAVAGGLFGVPDMNGGFVNGYEGALGGSNWLGNAFGSATPYVKAGLNAAAGNAITQGLSVAANLQDKFHWNQVAVSVVSGAAGRAAGDGVGRLTKSNFAAQLASGATSGAIRAYSYNHREVDWGSVATDTFGNAIGNSITSRMGQSREAERFEAQQKAAQQRAWEERLAHAREVRVIDGQAVDLDGNVLSLPPMQASNDWRGLLDQESNTLGIPADYWSTPSLKPAQSFGDDLLGLYKAYRTDKIDLGTGLSMAWDSATDRTHDSLFSYADDASHFNGPVTTGDSLAGFFGNAWNTLVIGTSQGIVGGMKDSGLVGYLLNRSGAIDSATHWLDGGRIDIAPSETRGADIFDKFSFGLSITPVGEAGMAVKASQLSRVERLFPEIDLNGVRLSPVDVRLGDTNRVAVIGRKMDAVEPYADALRTSGHDVNVFSQKDLSIPTYARQDWADLVERYNGRVPDNIVPSTKLFQANEGWAELIKHENYTVINLGDPFNAPKSSVFFDMEQRILFDKKP